MPKKVNVRKNADRSVWRLNCASAAFGIREERFGRDGQDSRAVIQPVQLISRLFNLQFDRLIATHHQIITVPQLGRHPATECGRPDIGQPDRALQLLFQRFERLGRIKSIAVVKVID